MKVTHLRGRILLSTLILAGFLAWHYSQDPKGAPEQAAPVIGAPFTLTNQYGETVSSEQLKGKYLLIFFGYTHCPDICPTTLLSMTNIINALGEQGEEVLPVFITVDPERDDAATMAQYAKNFHPSLVALTGPKETIDALVQAYKGYASKAAEAEKNGVTYLVQHSGTLYLMDREGKFIRNFSFNTGENDIAAAIRAELEEE